MTRYITLLSLATAISLTACGDPNRIPTGDWPWDDGGVTAWPDSGPLCDPEDLENLRTDFANCGSCGTQCSVDDADRCVNSTCMCGSGPPCTAGSDCIAGRCLQADAFTPCMDASECPNESGDQQCLTDGISEQGFCRDVCEFSTQCPSGFVCVEGACTRQECAPEACDGIDNDCDGIVDENSDGTGPLSQWCLTGGDPTVPPSPPCQRGTQVCSAGVWSECRDEIPPQPELGVLSCNGRDDDCDGCVDGTYDEAGMCIVEEPNGFDVLYLIDISGSMSAEITAVKFATANFSALYAGNPEFRFGIVLISGRGRMDDRAFVHTDFTDFTTFNTALSGITASGGGSEPTWDAIYEAATGEIAHGTDTSGDGQLDFVDDETRGLSWRDGSIRIMVMFADEEGQTSRERRGESRVNETVMCRSLTRGEFFVTFGSRANSTHFDDCGTHYELSSDPDIMQGHLEDIVADPCI